MEEIFKNSKKIIIKIGSSTITGEDGKIDYEFLENLASEVKILVGLEKQVVIVSSGARIAGVSTIEKWSKKEDMSYKQALCAIGQVELMDGYRKIFIKQGLHIAQILLTKADLENEKRSLNVKNTLFTLINENVIPIINENDTVCVDEIKIGDNDMLSARTCILWGADLLIFLSDIDGIFDKNPKEFKDAKLLKYIEDIFECEKNVSCGQKSSFGTGGIKTKIQAAKLLHPYGTNIIITKGKTPKSIIQILEGKGVCTLIKGEKL